MKENAYVFDLMDTLVFSPNLMKLFVSENPDLMRRYKEDRRKHQREAAQVADSYFSDERVEIVFFPETIGCLERLRQDGKIILLSNGTNSSIERIINVSGLGSLVDEGLSLEQFEGRDKAESELYGDVDKYLGSKGLSARAYIEDKAPYCQAACDSKVIPVVFNINRSEGVKSGADYKIIKSLDEISLN